jgi:hypothetical protein
MYGYRSSFVQTDGNANGVTVIPGDPLIQLLPTTPRFAWSNANIHWQQGVVCVIKFDRSGITMTPTGSTLRPSKSIPVMSSAFYLLSYIRSVLDRITGFDSKYGSLQGSLLASPRRESPNDWIDRPGECR